MQIFRDDFSPGSKTVVTIGSFDGVHRGHRTILDKLKSHAALIEGESVIITFEPHPRRVLYPDDDPVKLLTTLDEKLVLFEQLEIDKVWVIPFTPEFSKISYQDFIVRYLVEQAKVHTIVVGYEHRFGKNRTGGLDQLRQYAADWRFRVEEIPAFCIDEANVSSTKIRHAIGAGDVALAEKFLGYPHSLTGKVLEGKKLGRTLGFPTANLELDPVKLIPAVGVYAARVDGPGFDQLPAMVNIGFRPTVGGGNLAFEVHIIGFEGNLYGFSLKVNLAARLRDEIKFATLDDLKAQLQKDKQSALKVLGK
jgi:riboflavin kinase/FMN adenylyltransferase